MTKFSSAYTRSAYPLTDMLSRLKGDLEQAAQGRMPVTYRGWTIRHEPSEDGDGLDWTYERDGLLLRSFSEADCRDEIDGIEDDQAPPVYSLTPEQQAREDWMERVAEDESWIEEDE